MPRSLPLVRNDESSGTERYKLLARKKPPKTYNFLITKQEFAKVLFFNEEKYKFKFFQNFYIIYM